MYHKISFKYVGNKKKYRISKKFFLNVLHDQSSVASFNKEDELCIQAVRQGLSLKKSYRDIQWKSRQNKDVLGHLGNIGHEKELQSSNFKVYLS